jgi:hypothetical protein
MPQVLRTMWMGILLGLLIPNASGLFVRTFYHRQLLPKPPPAP